MIKQNQPSPWSCLVTAFANVIEWPVQELISIIGHDGSEIIWPKMHDPYRRRGHHIQEIIYVLHEAGYNVIHFQPLPTLANVFYPEPFVLKDFEYKFLNVLKTSEGVITGETKRAQPHAIAWNMFKCFDSGGFGIESLEQFNIKDYYQVIKSKFV